MQKFRSELEVTKGTILLKDHFGTIGITPKSERTLRCRSERSLLQFACPIELKRVYVFFSGNTCLIFEYIHTLYK